MAKKTTKSAISKKPIKPILKTEKIKVKSSDLKIIKPAKSNKNTRQPAASMDELMAQKEGELFIPQKNTITAGTITEISNRMVLVDIGAKTEGMVIDREFDEIRDFVKTLSVGDEIRAYIITPENDRGQILLSFRTAAEDWKWSQLKQWMTTQEVIEVRGLEVNKGGVVARIDSMDIRGFIPTSQLSGDLSNNIENLINRLLSVKIIEVNPKQNRLIFSEKYVSEAGEIAARHELLEKIVIGSKLQVTIAGLTDFGAFARTEIDKQEIEGLIHISELSWEKISDPSLAVKEGDQVQVEVIDVNPATGKVGFSLKRLMTDPWDSIEERYPAGKKIKGKVTKVASFGIFVQLEPGVSGLLHISKVPTEKEPKVGDEIEIMVEDLDAEHRRLSLSMVLEEIPIMYR